MRKQRSYRTALVFLLLLFLLFAGILCNIGIGSVSLPPARIFSLLFGGKDLTPESDILFQIRLPRLFMAAVLGGGLSVSGFLLQVFFRNPIAGPFVLGISSGSKMFVGFTMIFLLRFVNTVPLSVLIIASFLGSLFATAVVLFFAGRVKSMSVLLVAGVMIGYICSAATDFMIAFADEREIANLTGWSMGSFSGSSWQEVKAAAALIFAAFLVALLLSKPIGAYRLGESYAQSLGVKVKIFRLILILLSGLLSASVTAFAGPVSFVGIAVPHITRQLFKTTDPLVIIPGTFLGGSVFCLFCDLIARTAFAPTELSIGTVTAFFGVPVVLWLLIGRKGGEQV